MDTSHKCPIQTANMNAKLTLANRDDNPPPWYGKSKVTRREVTNLDKAKRIIELIQSGDEVAIHNAIDWFMCGDGELDDIYVNSETCVKTFDNWEGE